MLNAERFLAEAQRMDEFTPPLRPAQGFYNAVIIWTECEVLVNVQES